MLVIADTPIWSLVLRRKPEHLSEIETSLVDRWSLLVQAGRMLLLGPVRQEVLSGVRGAPAFTRLRRAMREFPNPRIMLRDYESAAALANRCRSSGIASSSVDMLICAVAARLRASVFTTDRDFERYAKHVPVSLDSPTSE